MTTINSQDDFLRTLAENPQWREAVRVRLLGEDLIQLPAKFEAFVERMDAFIEDQRQRNDRLDAFVEQTTAFVEDQRQRNDRLDAFVEQVSSFVEEQKRYNDRMGAFIEQITASVEELKRRNEWLDSILEEQRRTNDRHDRRFTTLSNDVAQAKAGHARFITMFHGAAIVLGMHMDLNLGIVYVRDVTRNELALMAHKAAGGDIATRDLRSFSRADLVVEAADENGGVCYVAVEASFTASLRDVTRAQRNAEMLTRFTGRPAYAVVSSVRNDLHVETEIAAGNVWWYEIDERDMEVE